MADCFLFDGTTANRTDTSSSLNFLFSTPSNSRLSCYFIHFKYDNLYLKVETYLLKLLILCFVDNCERSDRRRRWSDRHRRAHDSLLIITKNENETEASGFVRNKSLTRGVGLLVWPRGACA